jgi:hypothetical protein
MRAAAVVQAQRTTVLEAVAAEAAHPILSGTPRTSTVGKAGKTRTVTAWLLSRGNKAVRVHYPCSNVLSVVATALFAGPGGSQPPTGAPGAMPQSRAIATHIDRGWVVDVAASPGQ